MIACNHRKGGYDARLAVRADPSKASARQQRDAVLRPKIKKVWNDNWQVCGVRKTWRQLCREGETAALHASWLAWDCGELFAERQ